MKRFLTISALITGLALAFASNLAASSDQDNQENSVVAQVGSTKLTSADLEKKEAGSLLQARYQLYVSERKVLDSFVDKEILELKAKSEGLTVDQLLEKEAYKGIKDPTDDQLAVYYEGVESDQPFAAVKSQVLEHIRQLRRSKARAEYVKNLRSQSNVRILLAPPTADVNTQDAYLHGSKDAPVTLVEFADYECPYCQQIHAVLAKVEADYKDKVAFAYKDSPLPMHSHAQKAADYLHGLQPHTGTAPAEHMQEAANTTRSEGGYCGKMSRRECVRKPEGEICSAIRQ